jgi:hypothetical protein
MSDKKTIQINPLLFKMNKTKKNKSKIPIINPNSLKLNLMKKINQRRIKETNKSLKDNIENETPSSIQKEKHDFSNEFFDSLDHLNKLSKNKQKSIEKTNASVLSSESNLISHNVSNNIQSNYQNNPEINSHSNPQFQSVSSSIVTKEEYQNDYPNSSEFKYNIDNNIPFGCLKNGLKPTFKDWKNKTQKLSTSIKNSSWQKSSSEERLDKLKEKFKENINVTQPIPYTSSFDKPREHFGLLNNSNNDNFFDNESSELNLDFNINKIKIPEKSFLDTTTNINNSNTLDIKNKVDEMFEESNNKNNEDIKINNDELRLTTDILPLKKITKKFTKRTFHLGKSKKNRVVGVLIKNKNTRKKILHAQKEIKKTNINDIKKYLRDRGLIKVGSTAPSDVLRKTYENSILAGDIINLNKDNLIHNFLNSEKNDNL